MKSFHYAFADLHFYRKATALSVGVFSLFLLLANTLLNLLDINRLNVHRLMFFTPDRATVTNYQNWNAFYLYGYIAVVVLFFVTVSLALYLDILHRQSALQKWRLLGFSELSIALQSLLELIILITCSVTLVSLVLIIFQNTYETVLLHIHSLFENDDYALSVHSVISETVPASSNGEISQATELLALGNSNLSLAAIMKRLGQSTLLFTTICISCSLFFSKWGFHQIKKSLRK